MNRKSFDWCKNHLNFANIIKILLLPTTLYFSSGLSQDLVLGAIIGALLLSIFNGIKKYGIKRLIFFPENVEVRTIFEMIQNRQIEDLKRKVKGMPPEYLLSMRQQGFSPLIFACDSRDNEIVNFLLNEMEANPNEECQGGETALQRAIFRNDFQICKDLLEKGARLDYKFPITDLTPACYTILRGKPKLLNLLLEYGASLEHVANNKVVQDAIKTSAPEIKFVHFKHQRWRRLRSYLKLSSKLDGLSDPEHQKSIEKLNPNLTRLILQEYY